MSDCTNCSEYDKEKHFCPKWCDVIKSTIEDARADEKKRTIEECIKVVDEVIDECIENGGCKSKCDEPYACRFGIDVKANIEQLEEQMKGGAE